MGVYKKWLSVAVLALALALPLTAGAQAPTNGVTAIPLPESVTPGSLKDTVLSTLNNNPDVRQFQEYRQSTIHDISRARSGWLPRLDARVDWGMEQWSNDTTRNHNNNGGQNDYEFYERNDASLVLQQTIWDGFATWNRYQIGLARHDSATLRLLDNAEAASLDAILAHIEVVRQRELVRLSEQNVQNHKDILSSQEERQRLGAASLADVTQTRGRLAMAEASLTETRSALEIAMAGYQRITGKIPGELESPFVPANAYPSMEAVLAESQTANPKILALQSDVEAAKAQRELDKAPFYPQITVEVSPSYTWQAQGSEDHEWGTGVMLRMSWNLFDGFYDWYNVKGDEARMRQTREQLNSQSEDLANEAASTWSTLLSTREQVRFFEAAADNNTQTRDMYLQQFNVGQRSLLDVLDAENELYSTSMQLVTARLNEISALYRLKTLGGGLLAAIGVDKNGLNIDMDERAAANKAAGIEADKTWPNGLPRIPRADVNR